MTTKSLNNSLGSYPDGSGRRFPDESGSPLQRKAPELISEGLSCCLYC